MVRWKKLLLATALTGFAFSTAEALTLTWTGAGDGSWSNSANWSPSSTPISGDIVLFSGTPASFTSNVDINSDYSAVSFGNLTSDMTLNTSNASVITIDMNDTVSFSDSHNVTINVKIDGLGGLTMSNAAETGTVSLNAANQYFGPTSVNYGTLTDLQANSFSPQSQMNVGASGTLQVNFNETIPVLLDGVGGGGSIVLGSSANLNIAGSGSFSGVISGSGGLEISNGGNFNLLGHNTYTGNTTVDAASEILINDGSTLSQLSTITGLGTVGFENTGTMTFANTITGSMGVAQEGTGMTTLTAPNDYSGGTLITNGVLTDGNDNVFSPNSAVKIGTNGTLDIEHAETIPSITSYFTNSGTVFVGGLGSLTLTSNSSGLNATLTGGGSIFLTDSATLGLTGMAANTFNGNIRVVEGSTLQIGDGGLGAATVVGQGPGTVQLINDAPMTVTANMGNSSDDSLQLTFTGNAKATLTPSFQNQYSGNTRIDGTGILADGKDNSFSPNSVVNIDEGGTLENDFNETIEGLADGGFGGAASVTIAAGKTLTLFVTENSEDPSYSGGISGAGSLKVDGDGTSSQQLSGTSTYSGGTIVGNATLDLSGGSISHPSANLIVANNPGDTGTLIIEGGSSVTDGNAFVGNASGASGLVQVLGGSWTTTGTNATVGNGGNAVVDLPAGGSLNIAGGSGTLTLGNADSGAALFIGADVIHGVGENAGGVLNAATINGSASSLTIDDLVFNTDGTPETPYYFTNTATSGGAPIEIDGSIHVAVGTSAVVELKNVNSTYAGGTSVLDNGEVILGGSSSGGIPDAPLKGPIGVGTLTLGDNATVDITQSNVTLANTIVLSSNSASGGFFGNVSSPDNLALTGTISGDAQLNWLGSGTLTLSNPNSTFDGSTYINDGTLNLASSSTGGDAVLSPSMGPAGKGTIYLDNGSSLTRPVGANITINNAIVLENEFTQVAFTGDATGSLTLGGTLSDSDHSGKITISGGPVDLTGLDNVGRTVVNATTLSIEQDDGLQGVIVGAQSGAILNFNSANPQVGAISLAASTVSFSNMAGGQPVIGSIGFSASGSMVTFADTEQPVIQGLSDTVATTNTINLNGAGVELFLDNSALNTDITFHGTISGAGSLVIGNGDSGTVVDLEGNNTYAGTTTIQGGNLGIAGANFSFGGYMGTPHTLTLDAGSDLVVNPGVTLTNPIVTTGDHLFIAGSGTLAPTATASMAIQNGSVIAGGNSVLPALFLDSNVPGNAIGTLTIASTTNVTFGQGGVLQFSVMNDTGIAGTDYSTINVNGTLTLASSLSASHPFEIQLVGIDGPGAYDLSGNPNSFDFNSPHTWTLLTAGTIVNQSGSFDPANFSFETSMYFNGPGTGMWSVTEVGNTLDLNFSPVPEPSTWALIGGGLGILGLVALRRSKAGA